MAKLPLSKSRAEWAEQFKVQTLKGGVVTPNAGVRDWYEKKLVRIISDLAKQSEKDITRLFKAEGGDLGYSEDASLPSQARILLNRLKARMVRFLDRKVDDLVDQMIARATRSNSGMLHQSLKELSGGLTLKTTMVSGRLKETLKALTTENVSKIKSIGAEHHAKIEQAVMRSITNGGGLKELVPAIQKIGDVSVGRARAIAVDQTKKANIVISSQRMMDLGVQYFEWVVSSLSVNHRKWHEMKFPAGLCGGIFRLDDPPVIDPKTGERGLPGQLPNCNCRMRAVMKFDRETEA